MIRKWTQIHTNKFGELIYDPTTWRRSEARGSNINNSPALPSLLFHMAPSSKTRRQLVPQYMVFGYSPLYTAL